MRVGWMVKEVFNVVVLLGCVFLTLNTIFLFFFYDVALQCRLEHQRALLNLEKLKYTYHRNTKDKIVQDGFGARDKIIKFQKSWIGKIREAKNEGVLPFLITYGKYKFSLQKKKEKVYQRLKKKHLIELKKERKVLNKLRLIKAKINRYFNPYRVVFVSINRKEENINGYFYDPITGALKPRFTIQNRNREVTEGKLE